MKMLKWETIDGIPEILIYFTIQGLGDVIYWARRSATHFGADPDDMQKDIDNAYADQTLLLEELKSRSGFEFKDHSEYMLWYRWWNNWHKKELTDEEWKELDQFMIDNAWDGTQTEELFSKWRPKGSWKCELQVVD